MTHTLESVKSVVKEFIVTTVFNQQIPEGLTDSTPLVSTRLMDSISTMQMVSYLEEKFKIEFDAYEVNIDNLDTIDRIAAFTLSKIK